MERFFTRMARLGRAIVFLSTAALVAALAACSNPTNDDPKQYTIAYTLNGGTNAAENPASYTGESEAITLAPPTRGGYTGVWHDNPELTGSAVTAIPAGSTGNKAFYAKLSVIPYTIAYTLNGGTNAAGNPAGYNVESPAITLAAPARANHTFEGWHDNPEFAGEPVTGIPTGSTGNKTFYARWHDDSLPRQYDIAYTLNGGTNDPENPASYTEESPAITLGAPARDHYTFDGWHDNANFTGDPVTGIPAGSTGNKTFYAKWTAVVYAIAYELNGGTNAAGNPASYTVASRAITLAAPSRANYTFDGWHDNVDFTGSAITAIPAGSAGDKTFYAKWTPIT
jgi:uncharacterized repeat protein (TIGR02543 family)